MVKLLVQGRSGTSSHHSAGRIHHVISNAPKMPEMNRSHHMTSWAFKQGLLSSTPRCGSGPSAAWRPSPSTFLRHRTPPPHQPGRPRRGALQKQPGGGEGTRGWGEKGCGLSEGSSSCNGGMGGTFQRAVQLSWGRTDGHLVRILVGKGVLRRVLGRGWCYWCYRSLDGRKRAKQW